MVTFLARAPHLASLPRPPAAAGASSSLRSLTPPPAMSSSAAVAPKAAGAEASRPRKLPLLLFDVMDTVVRDPFYHHIPAFFQMSMKELLESKHPTAWSEFEMGLINENELAKKFFNDGRSFDLEGLKECMVKAYEYIDGVEDILCRLKQNNYEMHAFTNYPIWYQLIEDKLKLSKYLSWTFCSCLAVLTPQASPEKRKENASLRLIFIFMLWIISMWIQQAAFLLTTGWQTLKQLLVLEWLVCILKMLRF